MEATYKIVRSFMDTNRSSQTIAKGLTLIQAQSHCKDPETSSSTCKNVTNVERTRICGPWVDGYNEE